MITLFRLYLLAAAILCPMPAWAICSPAVPPPTRYVGNMASDSQCTDNSIQAAIDAVTCPGAKIVITSERTYTAQHLIIQDKSPTLIGTTDHCGPPSACPVTGCPPSPTAPLITISGAGQTGNSVLAISGNSNVALQYLEITGGNKINSGSEGGGIFFGGAGSLTLDTDTIDNNQADYGGGINVSATGATTLRLLANNYIISNTARTSGGGLRIEGDTHLIAVSDQTLIGFNKATSAYGGGMEVIGPARADIGSPGFGFGSGGVISNNTAAYGGGIAVIANQAGNKNAIVQLFTTNSERPVGVQDNTGTIEGGAVYAKPFAGSEGSSSFAGVCAFNFRMEGNTAPEGAVTYLDDDTGSTDSVNAAFAAFNIEPPTFVVSCGAPPSLFGGVACAADAPCNELSDNTAQDAHGALTDGALIFVTERAASFADKVTIGRNVAAHLVHGSGGDVETAFAEFTSSLIANNAFSHEPFLLEKAGLALLDCTVAQNAILASHVFKLDAAFLTMRDVIIGEHGPFAVMQSGDVNLTIDNVMSNDITTLPASSTVINQDPMFVDPANGDFHLQAFVQNGHVTASRAIDFAATTAADMPDDIDGNTYGQDVSAVPDFHGTRDLGAYEMRPINDRIFGDTFGDPLSLVR